MLDIAIVTDEISLDVRVAIAEAKKLGISKFELRCIGSYEERVPFIRQEDYQYLLELAEKRQIQITALSPGTFKVKPSDQAAVDHALAEVLPKTFAMAQKLQVPTVISFGFLHDETPEDDVVKLFIKIAQLAERWGLVIAIENEPGFFCDSGVSTARLLRKANMANLGANWDPANAIGTGELPYPIGYEALKPFVRNVHVKDAVMDARHGCKLLGEGGVNWAGQLMALHQDAIVSHVTLETHYTPLLESSQLCHRRLRSLIRLTEKEWLS